MQSAWLTVIAIAAEEFVVADEVGSVAEVRALCDEDLLDELEGVDDDAWCGAQGYAVDIAVYFGHAGHCFERWFTGSQKMETADNGPRFRTRQFIKFLFSRVSVLRGYQQPH